MNRTESIANLAKALAAAQKEIRPAELDKVNPHFRNRYASLASVFAVIREPLSKNGLAIIQGVVEIEGQPYLETMLAHESGEYITQGTRLMIDKPTMQGLGSAVTYARRYAIGSLLGVVTDDDDDGEEASKSPAPRVAASRPANPQPITPKAAEPAASEPKMFGKWTHDELKEFLNTRFGSPTWKDLSPEDQNEVKLLSGSKPFRVALNDLKTLK